MYETVFAISLGLSWELILFTMISIILLVFGIIDFRRYRKCEIIRFSIFKSLSIIPSILMGTLGISILAAICFIFFSNYKLLSIYKNDKYRVVEGEVFVLHEQSEAGHDKGDIIKIGNDIFVVDDFVITNAYTQTIAHGGLLREGTYVRVYYYGGKILRIDIRKEDLKNQESLTGIN